MAERILITGGAGFIGSNLSLKLLQMGFEVNVLDNLSKQIHGKKPLEESQLFLSIKDKVNFIHGSVTSKKDWLKAIKNVDKIVHFAAETGTGQSMYCINKYAKVNICGTSIILDILANEKHSISKIVVASSRAIYGEGKYLCSEHGFVYPVERKESNMKQGDFECKCPYCNGDLVLQGTDEFSQIHPNSIYGITKQNQEQMMLLMGKSLSIPTVSFRYQNVYGPGQCLSNPYTGILSIFSTQIMNENNINIFEDGKESRDFVFIDDVINATILGLTKKEADYNAYNVGYGSPISVSEVANILKDSYNSNIDTVVTGNYRLGDIRHNYADITKISKELGFKPQYSFKEGVSEFTNWVGSQNINQDKFDSSILQLKKRGLFK